MNTKDKQLKNLANKIAECTRCKDLAKSQKVFDKDGNSDSPLVFIAEAPGKHEDEQGKPLVEDGNAGKFFANVILKEMKLQRKEVFVCNILCCRPSNKNNPKKDRKPRQDEAEKCQEYLNQTLAIIKPKFICCLGRVAAQNFLETKKNVAELRRKPREHKGFTVVCTYHPTSRISNKEKLIREDIQRLMRAMGR